MSEIPFKNPGWAGNTGEYDLTEEQVRGIDFVGARPLEGGHPAARRHGDERGDPEQRAGAERKPLAARCRGRGPSRRT